jgi:murein DD-endopeptidase MepM/ murein hydrolase activator NlpD
MVIRIAELDQSSRSATSKLNRRTSPSGGDFGWVRTSGKKVHQGWDLYAEIGTPVYSVSNGVVIFVRNHGDYGMQLCLQLTGSEVAPLARQLGFDKLYAFYGHLALVTVGAGYLSREGEQLGLTGNSGNANRTPPHLHFEIRQQPNLGKGLHGRINPATLLGFQYYQCTSQR